MVFTAEQIGKIKSTAIAATVQLRSEFLPIEEERKKKEEAAERKQKPISKEILVEEAIAKIPICKDGKASIAELIKVITGLDISVPQDEKESIKQHIPFSMVVPTRNENSHDYPLNIPAMMLNGIRGEGYDREHGLQISGIRGNCLDWVQSGLRPATDNEIDMFFKIWGGLSEIGVSIANDFDLLGTGKKNEGAERKAEAGEE